MSQTDMPAQHGVPDPGLGDAPGRVGFDRYCVRCGYLLQGLSPTGRCPECGTDVALSLREPTLASSAPEYLAALRRGLSLVLNGILLMIILSIASGVVAGLAGAKSAPGEWAIEAASMVITCMMMWGCWLFTQPDPSQVAAEAQNAPRRIVRGTVAIQAGTTAIGIALALVAPPQHVAGMPTGPTLVAGIIQLAGMVALAVQFFATMRYLRWVAGRVPDRMIVARTHLYSWLLPILVFPGCFAFLLGPLIALILYWNLLDRLRKHVRSIIRTGSAAPLAGALTSTAPEIGKGTRDAPPHNMPLARPGSQP